MRRKEHVFSAFCIGLFLALKIGTVVALCNSVQTSDILHHNDYEHLECHV